MSDEKQGLIFISCGQYRHSEIELGQALAKAIDEQTEFEGYFARNQSSLDGLSRHIFRALSDCSGFVAVMHARGTVQTPSGSHVRASVWVEQEIAIAAFLQQAHRRDIPVAVYVQKGIHREGVRDQLLLGAVEFETENQVLADLQARIADGRFRPVKPVADSHEIILTFKDSPLLTAEVRQRIQRDFSRLLRYLERVGIEVPALVPPIGIQEERTGTLTSIDGGVPAYFNEIMLGGKTLSDPMQATEAFSGFFISTAFRNSAGNTLYRLCAEAALGTYFNWSFWNKKNSSERWADVFWNIREEHGQEFADKLAKYTIRAMVDMPLAGYNYDFDLYFYRKVKTADLAIDSEGRRMASIDAIVRSVGIHADDRSLAEFTNVELRRETQAFADAARAYEKSFDKIFSSLDARRRIDLKSATTEQERRCYAEKWNAEIAKARSFIIGEFQRYWRQQSLALQFEIKRRTGQPPGGGPPALRDVFTGDHPIAAVGDYLDEMASHLNS